MELGHDILWSLILKNNKQNVSTAVKCVSENLPEM